MYQFYEKSDYEVMYYRFYSLTEFITFLKTHPVCEQFPNPASEENDFYFTQTHSLEEAMELCLYGWHENFTKLTELKLKIEKYVKLSSNRPRQYNDYIGYTPDVKAYLEGNPLSMFNKKSRTRKKIDIYMNTSYNASTSVNAIYNRGAIILSIITILETLGYSVDLHLLEMCTKYQQVHFSEFILKQENERINPQKLYFPLCHPSWVRRLNFRLIEETKEANSAWQKDYGFSSNILTIKKIIETKPNDIIIPTIQELNIEGNDIIEDANSLFDYINNQTDKEFVLQRIKKRSI